MKPRAHCSIVLIAALANWLPGTSAFAEAGALGLFAPTTAQTGAPFTVTFNGRPEAGERVVFAVPATDTAIAGEYNSVAPLLQSPTVLYAPFVPGDYELLYLTGDNVIAARLPVHVSPARATVAAAAVVAARATLAVYWTGPTATADYIVIAEIGAPAGSYLGESGSVDANPVLLQAPDAPGAYEIRYVQHVLDLDLVLARQTITVEAR